MRTTVELSDRTYRQLRDSATDRGLRGFSAIVEEALIRYLDGCDERRQILEAVEAAEGSWSADDVADWEEAQEQAWSSWQTGRSSIPMS